MSFYIYRARFYFSPFNNNNNNRWKIESFDRHFGAFIIELLFLLSFCYYDVAWCMFTQNLLHLWMDCRSLLHGSAKTAPNKFMVKNDNQLKMVMINGIETSIIWKIDWPSQRRMASWYIEYRILAIGYRQHHTLSIMSNV